MNVHFTFITAAACTVALGIAITSIPRPALGSSSTLDVVDRNHDLVDHGGGRYTAKLQASGTLLHKGVTSNTSIELRCEVDDEAESLRCSGALRVNGVAAPIRLASVEGSARYAISNGFGALHMVAWDQWFDRELTDLVPPFDPGDDSADDSADDLGGDDGRYLPGDLVFGDEWTTRDYTSDDWLLIVDGIVANALCW